MVATKSFRLRLTDEQREELSRVIGREVSVLEFPDLSLVTLSDAGEAGVEPPPEPPQTLTREEHLHRLWVVLGLGD